MQVIFSKSTSEAIHIVTKMILETISSHSPAVLGLATGRTMKPLYKSLVDEILQTGKSLDDCQFFMLDEYMNLSPNHPSSFKHYIQEHLAIPLKINEKQFSFPPTHLANGPSVYEEMIRLSGGIHLQILGIGQNGHVGFNEPGSLKGSRTRIVKLSNETLQANKDQFLDIIPSEALTMGIETILESKKLVLLITGKSKADVVKYFLGHENESNCPATYLKSHPFLTVVLDPEAASKIIEKN